LISWFSCQNPLLVVLRKTFSGHMTFTRKSFQNWNVGEEALPCSRKIWMSVVNLPEMTSVSCGMTSVTGTSSVSADSRSLTSDGMG